MVRLIARVIAALTLTVHPGPTHHALAVDLHVAHGRIEHATKLAAERRAASEALVSLDPTRWPDWPLWRCTAEHELACNCVYWASDVGPFAGPFDIAVSTWQADAGTLPDGSRIAARWPRPSWAPPWAQVLGARHVLAAVGSGQWGGLRVCRG